MDFLNLKEKSTEKLDETMKALRTFANEVQSSFNRGTLKKDTVELAERVREDLREQLPHRMKLLKKYLKDPKKELNRFFLKKSVKSSKARKASVEASSEAATSGSIQ
jgi:hypothetical protein